MNTSEGNKLIADFMNLARDDTDKDFGPGYIVNDYKISDRFIIKTDVQYCSPEELPYHLSYDWLIPCIDKISNIEIYQEEQGGGFPIKIAFLINSNKKSNIVIISSGALKFKQIRVEDKSKLNAVYLSAVKFIEWYNENNQA